MMKKAIFILLSFFILSASAQEVLTKKQWQEDLRFLQNKVHSDFPFLFKKVSEEVFDAEVEKLYSDIPNLEQHQIIVGMSRIVALFQYGHSGLGLNQKPFSFHYLPFNLYQYNDGVYLQGVHKEYKSALGAKVIAINGVPIAEALKKVYPAVNAENEQYFKAFGINYLSILEVLHAQGITAELQKSVELSLEKNGRTFDQKFTPLPKGERVPKSYSHVVQDENWLDARDQSKTPLYLKNLDRIYFSEYLPEEKTLYVRHSQIQDDPEESTIAFYTRVFDFIEKNDVEKFVLDVRLNGGGNNFKNKSVITGIIKSEKINKKGKFFVIIGRRTFSACQNLVNELDNYTNVIFVGEPTAENINFYGDVKQLALPNSSIPLYLSFAWWQDKAPWESGEWTEPHIPVDVSFAEFSSNQDPVLEKVLAFTGGDFIPDPMQHMTNLFDAGKLNQLSQDVAEMINDPRYDFFDFETELSKKGYDMLGSGNANNALGVFYFIIEHFPNSSRAYLGLGESYLKIGDKDKATELFNKTIELAPNGLFGQKAKLLLKKMKEE